MIGSSHIHCFQTSGKNLNLSHVNVSDRTTYHLSKLIIIR